MAQHLLSPPEMGHVDPRRNLAGSVADQNSHSVSGGVAFTCNAAGTTTTALGADATIATGVNVVKLGEKFKLFTSAGTVKEETVFKISGMASSAGTTTITFTPAAAVATASGDTLKPTGYGTAKDNESLDFRLTAFNSTTYSQKILDSMTQNDKIYALRALDDPNSF